jgi:multiple sugar transport system permease protein
VAKMTKTTKRNLVTALLFISPWVIGFLVFTLGPIVLSVYYSFSAYNVFQPPIWIGLDNYTTIMDDPLFYKSLYNTVYYTALSVPGVLVLSLLLALLLNSRLKGMNIFRTIYFLPSVLSGVAVSLLWMWLFNPDSGLINLLLSYLGIEGPLWLNSPYWSKPALVIMSYWGLGGVMVINLAGLQAIPTELYEVATIDGASAWRKFWSITLPMISPTLFFNLITLSIGSFQVFTQAYVMTSGGPVNSTLFYVFYLYRMAFENLRMGYASALAWILFAIIMVFTLIQLRLSKRWVYYQEG